MADLIEHLPAIFTAAAALLGGLASVIRACRNDRHARSPGDLDDVE